MPRAFDSVLITGGAGFVGSGLAVRLKAAFAGMRVTALDNLRRRGSELNLRLLDEAGVAWIHGDVRSREDLAGVGDFDLLIECSAEPSAQAGYGGSPEYLIRTNLEGCFHCLELARTRRSAFLLFSTSRVYPYAALNRLAFAECETRFALDADQPFAGASATGIDETFPLEGARSLYGMTKFAAELMLEEYADAYGIPYVVNRFGLLTGPGQMAKSDQGVIALWVAAHHFKRDLSYIGFGGCGKQVRDLLHIDDACDLIVDQIGNFERYAGKRFNAGGGVTCSLSLKEATALCEEITGNAIRIRPVADNRPGDVRVYISDNSKISSVNGWRPRRDARATLLDIERWLRREAPALKTVLFGAK